MGTLRVAMRCSSVFFHFITLYSLDHKSVSVLHEGIYSGSLGMRGTFRVSLRTIKHRPQTSPVSTKALYLSSTSSTVRLLSNDGHDNTWREQPSRSYNPQWLGQEGTFSKTVTVSNVSPVVGYSPLSPFLILTLTWSLPGRANLVGHHSRMVKSSRQ